MNVFFLAPALVLVGGVTLILVLWMLEAGRLGRWCVGGLLVLWGLLVGWVVLKIAYPQLLYSRNERVYMDRLVEAIKAGKTRVPLQELVPFGWEEVCFVHVYSEGPTIEERNEVAHVMGQDVDWWTGWHFLETLDTDFQALLVFYRTPKGVMRFDDKSWIFTEYAQSFWRNRFYKNKLMGVGYSVSWNVRDEAADLRKRYCYQVKDIHMEIRREDMLGPPTIGRDAKPWWEDKN